MIPTAARKVRKARSEALRLNRRLVIPTAARKVRMASSEALRLNRRLVTGSPTASLYYNLVLVVSHPLPDICVQTMSLLEHVADVRGET